MACVRISIRSARQKRAREKKKKGATNSVQEIQTMVPVRSLHVVPRIPFSPGVGSSLKVLIGDIITEVLPTLQNTFEPEDAPWGYR